MTVEELKKSDKPMLTPADIAEVMESDPQSIRNQAAAKLSDLGFNASRIGNQTKIPRKAFLDWLGEGV